MSAVLSFGISGEFVALPGETVTRAACPERVSLFRLAKLFFTPGIDVTVTVTHLMSGSRIFLTVLEVPLSTVTGDSEQADGSRREACESLLVCPHVRGDRCLCSPLLSGVGPAPWGASQSRGSGLWSPRAHCLSLQCLWETLPVFSDLQVLFCFALFFPQHTSLPSLLTEPQSCSVGVAFSLVSVCISDKSSAFCVYISLERCRLYNIKSSHQVYISSVL